MSALLLLALSALAQEPAPLAPLTVDAASGSYRAEVRKAAGQERVADAIARWKLEVRSWPPGERAEPLWSCNFPHRPGERLHLLADDGAAFATVEREYSEARKLVHVWRLGERVAELSATALAVDHNRFARGAERVWLADGERAARIVWGETSTGPRTYLELHTSYGERRCVDLGSGAVTLSPGEVSEPYVEPPASRELKPGLRVPMTSRFSAPASIGWGEVLQVHVTGNHATPNWMFVGFELARDAEDPQLLVLTPVSSPPPANSVQAQVLQRFDAIASIKGLMPGRYRLKLDNMTDERDPQPFEVRPARPFVELERRGGILGLEQSLRVYGGGVVVDEWRNPVRDPARTYRVLAPELLQRLIDAARAVRPAQRGPRGVLADGFECRVTVWDGESERRAEFTDPGALGPLREIVDLLVR